MSCPGVLRISIRVPRIPTIANLSTLQAPSLTSFLTDSCGLSPAAAITAASKLSSFSKGHKISAQSKPESVLAFFQSHGFSPSQIVKLFSTHPRLLVSNPARTFQPKMEFYLRSGFSPSTLTKLITSDAFILLMSLKNRIIPSFDFLKAILHKNEDVAAAVKRSTWMLRVNLKKKMAPNIETLHGIGVPMVSIAKLTKIHPTVLMQSTGRFGESVKRVLQMGFSPSDAMFIHALHSVSAISVTTLERKLELYKSFGLPEDKILSCLKKNPMIVNLSEEKMRKSFGFFMEKLKWKPEFVFSYSVLLMLSIEKRVAPRFSVYEILASKNLLTEKAIFPRIFLLTEVEFVRRYLIRQAPILPTPDILFAELLFQKMKKQ
ncbi:hypothetical protein J5N97_013537 [Dioscorea zingiberensis]|uniref:Uncharacterized protein n=1 Tax=Dioscorea zingiberensis TaxID=325984 RepID=A0A9D5HIW2_9LILI|nr:hypothetical protein J5N97_013537 [Dioscorea zingiberensis]